MTKVFVLAGTAGTGKSSIGQYLVDHLSEKIGPVEFIEGDTLHPEENVKKMSHGYPLNDDDRWPWLVQVAHESANKARSAPCKVSIVSCSSLKLKYRDLIRSVEPDTQFHFIFLNGTKEDILRRLYQRKGHFMKPDMLDSQFQDLELPKEDEIHCFILQMANKDFIQIDEEAEQYIVKQCDK